MNHCGAVHGAGSQKTPSHSRNWTHADIKITHVAILCCVQSGNCSGKQWQDTASNLDGNPNITAENHRIIAMEGA